MSNEKQVSSTAILIGSAIQQVCIQAAKDEEHNQDVVTSVLKERRIYD